ncbi:MAG TPA: TIGR02757 family protein [Candidatus Mcinerneyibacterium sp.]|nr:TIGR02757 family protein [Candidatus Mcinerneyibacterium sp.]
MNLKEFLENIYKKYNKKKYVNPDPLIFLYDYPDLKNREIIGLLASSLAYGQVAQIIKTNRSIISKFQGKPYDYIINSKYEDLKNDFKNFVYRFTKSEELINFFIGIKRILKEYDTLGNFFYHEYVKNNQDILKTLECFIRGIGYYKLSLNTMLSLPSKKSACKRLFLYLRWMIRDDDVDPGGWNNIDKSELIYPMDTHMFKIAKLLKFTKKKQVNLKTAVDVTKEFNKLSPEDPVKYDFSLTRFGIRNELKIETLKNIVEK